MPDTFDKSSIMDSFVAEVHSYLPRIKADIDGFGADATQTELLEESYRLAHTVKNSSLMMGCPKVGKVAQPIEEVLSDILEGRTELGRETAATISRALQRIEALLGALKGEAVNDWLLMQDNDEEFGQLRELTKKGKLTPFHVISPPSETAVSDEEPSSAVQGEESAAVVLPVEPADHEAEAEQMPADTFPVAGESPIAAAEAELVEMDHEVAEPEGQDTIWQPTTEEEPAQAQVSEEAHELAESLPAFDEVEPEFPAEASNPETDGLSTTSELALQTPAGELAMPAAGELAAEIDQNTESTPEAGLLLSADEATADVVEAPELEVLDLVEEYGGYLDTALGFFEQELAKTNRIVIGLIAQRPELLNASLLMNRRFSQVFASIERLATPLSKMADTIEELRASKATLINVATDLSRKGGHSDSSDINYDVSSKEESTTDPVPDSGTESSASAVTEEQMAELRAAIEKEVKEALLEEVAAEREMAEQQEAERLERLERELRFTIEAEVRAEMTRQFAQPAQPIAPFSSSRTITVSAAEEQQEDDPFEELPQELIEAFSLEAKEHLLNISRDLSELEKNPANPDLLRSIRRSVHTLKGAAATMGFRVTGELAHVLEDLLDEVNDGHLQVNPTIESLMLETFDALEDLVSCAVGGKAEDRTSLELLRPRYKEILATVRNIEEPEEPEEAEEAEEAPEERAPIMSEMPSPAPQRGSLQVHLGIERLNDVTNLVGELLISRATFEQRMLGMKQALGELDLSTSRLKRLIQDLSEGYEVAALLSGDFWRGGSTLVERTPSDNGHFVRGNGDEGRRDESEELSHYAEFDDLEMDRYTEFHRLTRQLTEAAMDMSTVGGEMDTLMTQFDSVLTQQSRINSELQDRLMRLRLVPLSDLTPRLYRAVRNVALAEGKEVDLVLEGENVEVDKTVFEGIGDALLHLMRNSVDHGIEDPATRIAAGKAPKGRVMLQAYYEGNQVIIKVSDDGRGISPTEVRQAALANGFIRYEDEVGDAELIGLLFQPGFTTVTEVSETSGRGVGLDVVRTDIERLRGTVQVASTQGEGSTFTIQLPLTLAVVKAQLVKAGGEVFAIPLSQVEQILRLGDQQMNDAIDGDEMSLDGETYRVFRLNEALALPEPPERAKSWAPILIARVSDQRVAVVVDEIQGQQDIVIKSMGDHFKSLKGITGATILGNGRVILILDIVGFLRAGPITVYNPPPMKTQSAYHAPLDVLVVDDSPSVRRVVVNMLEKAGLNASTARDGVEALEMIQARQPDAILLDIEMPRMDGYELLSTLKNQEAYQNIPVVMLTSRSGGKHRQKAMELGANGYLVKPYKDEELLSALRNAARSI